MVAGAAAGRGGAGEEPVVYIHMSNLRFQNSEKMVCATDVLLRRALTLSVALAAASSAPDVDCGSQGLNWQLSASGASCDDACSLVGESCVAIADWPSEARTFDCMGSVAQENGKACDSNGDGFWEHRPSINAILSGDDCAKNSGSPVTTRRR